jgi:saccharopine dehydrogenase (NADP+, L-glutamate forming)
MTTVHWLGAGLSSSPGIQRLAALVPRFVLWNRTEEKARQALAGSTRGDAHFRPLALDALAAAVQPSDVVISMLPAAMHPAIAELCLQRRAHLVTTSYLSDAMRALDGPARAAGLSFINEAGLDPGIDHLLAHRLVAELEAEGGALTRDATVSFRSYCGGFPAVPGPFRYKFSWSPLGVLRALCTPARYLQDGTAVAFPRPFQAVAPLVLRGETFEAYPNRDSLPYVGPYGLGGARALRHFVRGTLRPAGWSQAWSEVFAALPPPDLDGAAAAAALERLSAELWTRHRYAPEERDRVVLSVALAVTEGNETRWERSYLVDETGTGADTAMARLVSRPASCAVLMVLEGRVPPGVQSIPGQGPLVDAWLRDLGTAGIRVMSEGGDPARPGGG